MSAAISHSRRGPGRDEISDPVLVFKGSNAEVVYADDGPQRWDASGEVGDLVAAVKG